MTRAQLSLAALVVLAAGCAASAAAQDYDFFYLVLQVCFSSVRRRLQRACGASVADGFRVCSGRGRTATRSRAAATRGPASRRRTSGSTGCGPTATTDPTRRTATPATPSTPPRSVTTFFSRAWPFLFLVSFCVFLLLPVSVSTRLRPAASDVLCL
jgi:hypothetical protein